MIKSFINGLDKTTSLDVGVNQASKEKLEKLVNNLKNTRGSHDFWACEYCHMILTTESTQTNFHFSEILLLRIVERVQHHVPTLLH